MGWGRMWSYLAALWACGPAIGCTAGHFVCSDATDCRDGAIQGTCQANGSCSFDDETCPSGQRYGSHAAHEVAGQCVPQETIEGSTSHDGTTTHAPGTAGASASTTSNTSNTSTTSTSSATSGTTSAPDGTTSEDSASTTSSNSCGATFFDAFAGNAIDPQWVVTADPAMAVEVTDGRLVFTFAEQNAWTVLASTERFDVSAAEAILEVEHFTSSPYGTELNFIFFDDEARARIAVCCDEAYAQTFVGDEKLTHGVAPWTGQRYLRLRTFDDAIHFEVSPDGEQWTSLAVEPSPLDLSNAGIAIAGGTWEPARNPGFARIESVELCGSG